MRKTLKEQKALHANLMMSKPTLTANILALSKNFNKLEANISDKADCIKVDQDALLLDGRKAPSVAPSNASYRTDYVGTGIAYPPRSGGSNRSSLAESLRSRISDLEDELAATRRSNDELTAKREMMRNN